MTWNKRYEWFERDGGGFIAHEVGVVLEFVHEGTRFVELVPACEYLHHRVSFSPPDLRKPNVDAPDFPGLFRVLEERPTRHCCPKCFCDPLTQEASRDEVVADVQRRIARYVGRNQKEFYKNIYGEEGARFDAETAVYDYNEQHDDRPDPFHVRLTPLQRQILEILRTERELDRGATSYGDVVCLCRRTRRTNCDGQVGQALRTLCHRGLIAWLSPPQQYDLRYGRFEAVW